MNNALSGRTYSYVRTSHLILLGLALAVCFAIAFYTTFRVEFKSQLVIKHWYLYDAPWLITALLAWAPTVLRARYQSIPVTISFKPSQDLCLVDGDPFAGWWKVNKSSPQSMGHARLFAPILTVFIVGMGVMDIMAFYHSVNHHTVDTLNDVEKFNTVQGLCVAFMLLGIVLPLWSFRKYPYLIALRQKGRWLSVQCESVSE